MTRRNDLPRQLTVIALKFWPVTALRFQVLVSLRIDLHLVWPVIHRRVLQRLCLIHEIRATPFQEVELADLPLNRVVRICSQPLGIRNQIIELDDTGVARHEPFLPPEILSEGYLARSLDGRQCGLIVGVRAVVLRADLDAVVCQDLMALIQIKCTFSTRSHRLRIQRISLHPRRC